MAFQRRKQLAHSFCWNFYMNATAEEGPRPQGISQRVTQFMVLVTQLHNYTHIRAHDRRSVSRRCVYISSLQCFTAADGLSCINSCHQDLNPDTWPPHFTSAQSAMFGLTLPVSLAGPSIWGGVRAQIFWFGETVEHLCVAAGPAVTFCGVCEQT